ncbi:hypothetical protein MLD38_033027 [Melastoma candidum]|uniref:Uncharacterized protein n=1 Tax=Melastoma candidum TaxID=119954 RepID=A0ACB9M9T2_9MYRT|nr:hypothetical protein MLD38_033027 [Melastoma candidum]
MVFNNKQQQRGEEGSPNWWWLDAASNNAAAGRSPWLRSALSELDEKTTAMLKLIEADADSFAQRAEMYYRKRPDLVGIVEEFYRMHRSLAERFDQLKSDSATRLLTTLGSPFSCDGRVPLRKSFSLSPDVYKNYDAYSDMSDDHEDNPESEVDDPEEDNGTELIMPRKESGGELPPVDGDDQICKLMEEVERLKEENRTLRDQMARMDATGNKEVPLLGTYKIRKLEDENKMQGEQKAETLQKEENKEDEGNKKAVQPLSAASMDTPKEEEDDPIPTILAQPKIGKSNSTIEPDTMQVGNFLRRLFPKSSKKCIFTRTLKFH